MKNINLKSILKKENKNEDLKVAVLFDIDEAEEDAELIHLYPLRPVVGTYDEENLVFEEALTGINFLPSNSALEFGLNEGYNFVGSLKKLKDKLNIDNKEAISIFWNEYKDKIFVYDFEKSENIIILNSEEYKELYGIPAPKIFPSRNISDLIVKLVKGEITNEELIEKANEISESLDDEKDFQEEAKVLASTPISEYITLLNKSIISQEEPIKKLLINIYSSLMFDKTKSNILLYGPTGVGKTELVRTLAKVFNLPIQIEDLTQYTDAGYVGSNPLDALVNLYINANGNLDLAEHSILVLDEIDKKASSGSDKEFNKTDVLKSFLKIIEGHKFMLKLPNNSMVEFDTSKLIIIAMGAFSDLTDTNIKKEVGFNKDTKVIKTTPEITAYDFVKYGVPIEFLGRFNSIIKMNSLTIDDLKKILNESNLSSLKRYKEDLLNLGVKTIFSEDLSETIARKAFEKKTGARALNNIVEDVFQDILFEIFNNPESIEEISINPSGYVMKRKKENEKNN